ncbi:disulfide bond formation protein B [Acuticoccus sp. MNP-M23]|uniref:disulfide bond formation protein B n=1 Tax=Acuticoccus sp. MNP-M23 TaxID=3072793 RepID=UPI0028157509|nr:disulfide bond formation protein B [Acuticoccus sp. MNP-M23]WMS42914.1 disulfide bond formation protein B [Acuticoccus sp. MNP-M23]
MIISGRPFALSSLLVMLAAIGTAWGFQLIGGYVPCALCLEQRLGYYAAIPLAIIGFLIYPRMPALARIAFAVAAAAMVWSAGLGVYHAGAEWGFWPGPADCGGGEQVRDASNLLAAIEGTRLVSCTEAAGRFLGISFAGWNAVAAGMAALLLLRAALFAPPSTRPR